ncbi:Carbonic anhydrase [Toxocara canis]|uniref:Carbonic anhydrase n=1 Tax=Toxocara canis TaxID=6265 RepID=A0A0B2UNG7_TOXCA|nr:Carbonic anhydrase [Toxocara canis]
MSVGSRSSSRSSTACSDGYDGSSGKQQSPINILKEMVDYDQTLKASQLKFSYTVGDVKTIEILPHGFTCKANDSTTSTLTGTHLPAVYRFREFHGHWGNTEEDGSEHRIHGRAFSGELHFTFWNPKYKKYKRCLDQPDGVAILAVFLLANENDNENFRPLLTGIEESMAIESPVDLAKEFDLSRLLPEKLFYYTYEGSLTAAPFNECVIWTVLHRPVPIGISQLDVLRTVTGDNARAMQEVNGRRVRSSFKLVPKKK